MPPQSNNAVTFSFHMSDLSCTDCPSLWQYVFCLLKHITEAEVEGLGGRGRRHKQLLDDLKEMIRYWKLKEDAWDHTL
jgi:hypothetical protein